ncbi:MAG TPA: hypothetical protein VNL71_12580 [Chloroflexota bacterium]|nr:hypothetical protein [Chloroflexota bacterium]
MSEIYFRHEGYGHGSSIKMVRHRVKEEGRHLVTTACGKDLDRRSVTPVEEAGLRQAAKSDCRRLEEKRDGRTGIPLPLQSLPQAHVRSYLRGGRRGVRRV